MTQSSDDFFNPITPPFTRGGREIVAALAWEQIVAVAPEDAPPAIVAACSALQAELIGDSLTSAQRLDYYIARWMLTGDDAEIAKLLAVADDRTNELHATAQWAIDSLCTQSPLWRAAVDRVRSTALRN